MSALAIMTNSAPLAVNRRATSSPAENNLLCSSYACRPRCTAFIALHFVPNPGFSECCRRAISEVCMLRLVLARTAIALQTARQQSSQWTAT